MTKIKTVLFLSLVVALLASCSSNSYKKTASGIMYKISSNGSAPLVKRGEILKFHYTQKLNDSLMQSSFGSMPAYAKVDSSGPVYSPLEVLAFLHKGDSVTILQLADSIMKNMPPGQPSQLKKGDKIYLTLKVLDVLKTDELAQADQMKEMASEEARSTAALDKYMSDKKINAQKTANGVYVEIKEPGTGEFPDSGKFVSVTYTGKSFPSMKEFESNVGKAPIQFTMNKHEVIDGWDEGLKLLKKGGKATLYIPGAMAYKQQAGPGGKPFESLIFDVILVDIANSAPATAPQMPGMPPQAEMPQR